MKSRKPKKEYFPDTAATKRIRDRLSAADYSGGNLALPDDASEVDRAKYQLCQLIARYQREHELSQRAIAKKLGVDEARISEVLRGRIDSFTLDRLIDYAVKLYPGVKVEITAA